MSTVKNTVKLNKGSYKQRFAELAKMGILVFHSNDLANLWQIKNPNTLHTTLKRYAKEGLITRIQRGFYSLQPAEKIDPFLLGVKILHRYAYISTETILARSGIIFQEIPKTSIISSISKTFFVAGREYRCRRLADKYLYNDAGIVLENGVQVASTERAVADILYFNPRCYFDGDRLIDWKKVRAIQREIGYPQNR
ncbi:MAG: hypothetical protein A2489_02140 [Candidatus Moranbacteria bacterium RIFOXYC12_FULL_36_13]|nr:MAG: hypothetical protein UR78_C0016G0018 [Candidatus Moranbacteria bacterium GW2011_GWF2_35_39]OGI32399.1 MAG: hypothetical protein A2489_02140 [Candidatus Moranbacteria bacterium RIFOXYC12_FULL_36_13]